MVKLLPVTVTLVVEGSPWLGLREIRGGTGVGMGVGGTGVAVCAHTTGVIDQVTVKTASAANSLRSLCRTHRPLRCAGIAVNGLVTLLLMCCQIRTGQGRDRSAHQHPVVFQRGIGFAHVEWKASSAAVRQLIGG